MTMEAKPFADAMAIAGIASSTGQSTIAADRLNRPQYNTRIQHAEYNPDIQLVRHLDRRV
ncbi:MAG TPA: hypothetical protein VH308_00740 [Terracidiphilus sp.]|nr:hypothetical protein [Terracidiphilus sp.]